MPNPKTNWRIKICDEVEGKNTYLRSIVVTNLSPLKRFFLRCAGFRVVKVK